MIRVDRNFEEVYEAESDPWGIGDAESPRYNRYVELLRPYVKGSVLDIGCGMGALLARFRNEASELFGVELSRIAIERGVQRFPFIQFYQGSATSMEDVVAIDGRCFDVIICSDVIYYLEDRYKDRLIAWIGQHLAPGGKALIAAYCPGKKYLKPEELISLTESHLKILHREDFLMTQHLALITTSRRRLAALTIDYETWQPIPEGKCIDWDKDIFDPAQRLMEMFERVGVTGTFFIEMGEYFWLDANQPLLARRMEEQWRDMACRGHDVQLHLHPSWLPETGASFENGTWLWDMTLSKAADYPGDLTALIRRCKAVLETVIRPVKPNYTVTCFRAGAYQAQPFEALSKALLANGVTCDSSVYPGGGSAERGYDYSHAYTTHQPYFADLLDPQLRAVPAEEKIVELPIFTPEPKRRWFLDGDEGELLAARLIRHETYRKNFSTMRLRSWSYLRKVATMLYCLVPKRRRGLLNRLMPRAVAHRLIAPSRPRRHGDRYFVAIGHTKADLNYEAIAKGIEALRSHIGVEFLSMTEMAKLAENELTIARRPDAQSEIAFQVARETPILLGGDYNDAQSNHLQAMIPLDCSRLLDFGCGAGQWSARIAKLYPWMEVVGVDAGEALIERARECHAGGKVSFEVGDFTRLAHADSSFDCVYADNTLEHCFDLDAALSEIKRILMPGGVLVAAIPLDGLNPEEDCDNHTWKTIQSQAVRRLERAGFNAIHCEQLDTFSELGQSPYGPSFDQMLYLRAWKVAPGDDRLARALRAMDWVYRQIEPTQANLSEKAEEILADGYGWCISYAVTLGQLLKREGYDITWITMRAKDHERGSGPDKRDAHEVLEIVIDGERHVLDPMANTHFPCSLAALLANPSLATRHAWADERGRERGYDLYNTAYWYERTVDYSRRSNIHRPSLRWKKVHR